MNDRIAIEFIHRIHKTRLKLLFGGRRPKNVLADFIRCTDYRGREAPAAIRITHHKTGAVVLHPLEETVVSENVERILFYADVEAVLARLPRRGIPMILHETRDKVEDGPTDEILLGLWHGILLGLWHAKWVRRLRKLAKLPQRSLSRRAAMAV